jgi:release factor glutamine methyltransferase
VRPTLQTLLDRASGRLAQRGCDSPRLTAEVLLAHAIRANRTRLFMEGDRQPEATEVAHFEDLVARRLDGTPTHHLVREREFFGRSFLVDSRGLIPRPETELLVAACLEALPRAGTGKGVLDLCSGSGCVGLTLLAERPELHVTAVDLSEDACALARENAVRLAVEARFELFCGDLFGPLENRVGWDLIVANPPYVRTAELQGLPREIRDHEPLMALDGGVDGLEVLRRIAESSPTRLAPGGLLALEIGEDQGLSVAALLRGAGFAEVRIAKDYSALDRIATCRRHPA